MEQAYPPGGENPSWGEVPEKKQQQQQQQQKPPAMSQPTDQYYTSSPKSGAWQTGIWGCCSDMDSYCWACWCPCVQFGRNFEIIEEGNTSCLFGGGIFYCIHQHGCCGAMYSCGYRRKLRLKYGLPERPCDDYCTECCCLPCSLAQQTRELKSRGVDAKLGWQWEPNREAYLNSVPQGPMMQR
ncbi:hypothetical protein CY35_12G096900 [Sphagnum magellanicum]|nr:hypothetical protein CY35_12G096900 [Sphagnum magellanicum]